MYGDSVNPMTQDCSEAMAEASESSMPSQHYNEHYLKMAIQPIAVMHGLLTREEYIGFLKGNIIKYSMRQGLKAGESAQKDAAKARTYISLLNKELGAIKMEKVLNND